MGVRGVPSHAVGSLSQALSTLARSVFFIFCLFRDMDIERVIPFPLLLRYLFLLIF